MTDTTILTLEQLQEFTQKLSKATLTKQDKFQILKLVQGSKFNYEDVKSCKLNQIAFKLSKDNSTKQDDEDKKIIQISKQLVELFQQMSRQNQTNGSNSEKKSLNEQNLDKNKTDKDNKTQSQKDKDKQNQIQQNSSNLSFIEIEFPQEMDQIQVYDYKMRNQGTNGLFQYLNQDSNQCLQNPTQQRIISLACQIEQQVYKKNYQLYKQAKDQLEQNYKNDIKIIISYLKDEKNGKFLKTKIFNGLCTPQQISTCETKVFISEELKEMEQKKEKQAIDSSDPNFYQRRRFEEMRKNPGEKCKICKQMTAYLEFERQTRASDEPMTRFMICCNPTCQKQYRD